MWGPAGRHREPAATRWVQRRTKASGSRRLRRFHGSVADDPTPTFPNLRQLSRIGSAAACLVLSLILSPQLAAQEDEGGRDGVEIVRGRIFGPDSLPLAGASVTVLGVTSQVSHTVRTNDRGLYTVLFTDPEGDYLVTIRHLGMAPQTHRVTRMGTTSQMLVLDVRLAVAAQVLEPVTIAGAMRRAPSVGDALSVGGDERNALGGKLFSLDPSDLYALAASVPGVLRMPGADGRPGGFSVLGLSPDQNSVTVDGSPFEGNTLPQDAIARATTKTTTYDASQGEFSGGQLTIGTRGGNDTFAANVRSAMTPAALSWADPAAPKPVSSELSLGGSLGGPIRRGKAYYFGSIESKRASNDLMSLLNPNEIVLAERGIARDTVERLAGSLGGLGIPVTSSAFPDRQGDDRLSGFARIDLRPTATSSFKVQGDGNWTRQHGADISALTFPAQGSGRRSDKLGLQASSAIYLKGYLSELTTYLQTTSSASEPYALLPGGDVRVGTAFDDGRTGLTSLLFGGGNASLSRVETRKWDTRHELSRMTVDSRHRLKFGQSFSLWDTKSYSVADPFGRFEYSSLADLEANIPASYARTLDSRERSSKGVQGAVWVGDEWRRGDRLRMKTGVRVDFARSGTRPMYNPAVDSLFGLRTDEVPRDIGFSPRLGFSWTMRPFVPNSLGSPRMPIVLAGGLGAFRGVISPAEVANLTDMTGLPNTVRSLRCVGEATPIPDWSLYGADSEAIPLACVDGGAPIEFSDAQPRVTVYDPGFRAPLSWRGNLSLKGLRLAGWHVSLGLTQQLGYNGRSAIDHNLRRAPVFTLPEEAGRPVFVAPATVVPATGRIGPSAARISDRFGTVTSNVSDLRNVATQLTMSSSAPRPLFGKLDFSATYTFTRNRAQERGFNGSTAGDPFLKEWAEGRHPNHQISLQSSIDIKWINLGLRANIYSGVPYTPMVAGDVNGDGMRNDRAFVFDAATTSDTELGSQMRALLDAAPTRARDCLLAQVGRVAARNSCNSGWRFQPDISFNVRLPTNRLPTRRNVSLWDRLELSVRADNIVGALLRLVDVEIPRGWGRSSTAPDQTLLHVEGFDPMTQQFRYRVNQQFGDMTDRARTRRNRLGGGAFRVQLGGQLKFGGPSQSSMAEQLGFIPGRGEPALTVERAKDLLRRQAADPIDLLRARQDSLALTADQLAQLGTISRDFGARVDSAITPLAEYVVSEGKKLKDAELQRRLAKLIPGMQVLLRDALSRALAVLTDEQRARVPALVRLANTESRKPPE